MRSSTIIALLPLAATTVFAGCYKDGKDEVFGNPETANNALTTICTTMSGYYQPQQFRSACASVQTESTYWYFFIKQEGWGDTMTHQQCMDQLKARYCNKNQGGEDSNNGWFYR